MCVDDMPDIKKEKLCPFRKNLYHLTDFHGKPCTATAQEAEYIEEEFQPCLEEKCALYNRHYEQCGMMNRFN